MFNSLVGNIGLPLRIGGDVPVGESSYSGDELSFNVHIANDDISDRYIGTYFPDTSLLRMAVVEVGFGGKISGALTATLEGGNDVDPIPMQLDATFYAEFPE
jgi:hypothetical protein